MTPYCLCGSLCDHFVYGIFQVLPVLEPKSKEIPSCDLVSSTNFVSSTNKVSVFQDNYEEVEMDIDDTSSSIGEASW